MAEEKGPETPEQLAAEQDPVTEETSSAADEPLEPVASEPGEEDEGTVITARVKVLREDGAVELEIPGTQIGRAHV